ncbi:MAG: peptide-methionine (S)-S-oxide reductase MsrA, partial [Antricoccus sp.]
MGLFGGTPKMIDQKTALKGREDYPFAVAETNVVTGNQMLPPYPDGFETAVFGMGCFWGAERIFWQLDGVWTTYVGYAGGFTPYPTYEEVCSGSTGHAEVAVVVFDPKQITFEALVAVFYENHNPTTLYQQGNDVGTQYRSTILTTKDQQIDEVKQVTQAYQVKLTEAHFGEITTTVGPVGHIYAAEGYHQQYLKKNPNGYCNHGFNGVSCPVG